MAMELPASPKVYTTVYDNFKGVDFTNDASNVWRKRSPDGLNMLPDESGRPFKRNGWEVLLTNADICDALGLEGEIKINKLAYFELAGKDHIAIFTNVGLIFYNGELTTPCTEADCYLNYDRCFFFEGNGTSAFYIYGNYRVWKYWYNVSQDGYPIGYNLTEVTDDLTVPLISIGTVADGTGTPLEAYNMLGSIVHVEYCDTALFTWWGTWGLVFSVKDAFKTGKTLGSPCVYHWKCTDPTTNPPTWADQTGASPAIPFDYTNIDVVTPELGAEVVIIYANGLVLPANVSVSQGSKVRVWESNTLQFDKEMTLVANSVPLTDGTWFHLHEDPMERADGHAWIEFKSDKVFNVPVPNEDYIRVETPTNEVVETPISASATGTAELVGEVV